MSLLRIKENCLYVEDLDRSRSFYEGILGLRVISHQPGDHIFFRVGESVLLCFIPERSRAKKEPPPHFGKGELHLAFEADEEDYERWKQELPEKGVPIEQVQNWHQGRKESFYFRDPDRHLLEILQKGIWDVK